MSLEAILFQALNGLAAASSLFFVGAGLSLIFGVTRIINIAHGSFYMLRLYLAATFATKLVGGLGFWRGILAAGPRRTARWSVRSAATRPCCSRWSARSAPSSPDSAARCRWRASPRIWGWTWS